MKSGINHIVSCFKAYGFLTYQCTDIYQYKLDFIALNKNVSIIGCVVEVKGSMFDIKKDIDKDKLTTLLTYINKAISGVVIYSAEQDCYYRLPTELIQRANELGVRHIVLTSMTLYSKVLEIWRNNVNEDL